MEELTHAGPLHRAPSGRSGRGGQILPGEQGLDRQTGNSQITDAGKEIHESSQNTHALEAQRDGPNAALARYSTDTPV